MEQEDNLQDPQAHQVEPDRRQKLHELVVQKLALEEEIEKHAKQIKAANELLEAVELRIIEMMQEEGLQNFTMENRTFYFYPYYFVGQPEERRTELFSWLREHEAGDLIKEVIHPSTLLAWFKEIKKLTPEKVQELIDRGLLTFSEETRLAARKKKGT